MDFENANDLLQSIMNEGNVAQGKAMKLIFTTKNHIFITGRGGTGKTFFLKRILPFLGSVSIVAPTGIAALNAGGSTIHSYFGFNLDPYIPEIKNGKLWNHESSWVNPEKIKMIKSLDTLVIDEISMVRADLLDRIGDILRKVRKNNKPFGGVRLLMFGDLSQLPPIVNDDIFFNYYDSRYFFSSKSLMLAGYNVCYFEKNYRQKDEKFINILDNIRFNSLTKSDIDTLNDRVYVPSDDIGCISIVPTNQKAASINTNKLNMIPNESVIFNSLIIGTPPKESPCEQILELKIGAQVMITRNGSNYVNGSVGHVIGFEKSENDDSDIICILVKLSSNGEIVKIHQATWNNIKYVDMGGVVGKVELGSITQFPIKLGWSISVHKSQGLSLDNAYIDTSRSFESGQVYTAMSRCRTLEGLYLMNKIDKKDIMVDDNISNYYNKMKKNDYVFDPLPISDIMNKKDDCLIDFEKYGL